MANLNRYMQDFPSKGRGLGHVSDPKNFWQTIQNIFKIF